MTIAASVQDCLAREGVHYDMIAHERTRDSSHSAHAAHIPGDRLAKCVMLEDDQGYLMAVVPASHKVDLGAMHRQLNRELGLANPIANWSSSSRTASRAPCRRWGSPTASTRFSTRAWSMRRTSISRRAITSHWFT